MAGDEQQAPGERPLGPNLSINRPRGTPTTLKCVSRCQCPLRTAVSLNPIGARYIGTRGPDPTASVLLSCARRQKQQFSPLITHRPRKSFRQSGQDFRMTSTLFFRGHSQVNGDHFATTPVALLKEPRTLCRARQSWYSTMQLCGSDEMGESSHENIHHLGASNAAWSLWPLPSRSHSEIAHTAFICQQSIT